MPSRNLLGDILYGVKLQWSIAEEEAIRFKKQTKGGNQVKGIVFVKKISNTAKV